MRWKTATCRDRRNNSNNNSYHSTLGGTVLVRPATKDAAAAVVAKALAAENWHSHTTAVVVAAAPETIITTPVDRWKGLISSKPTQPQATAGALLDSLSCGGGFSAAGVSSVCVCVCQRVGSVGLSARDTGTKRTLERKNKINQWPERND